MILLFLLTYHLSMLKSYQPRPAITWIYKGGCQWDVVPLTNLFNYSLQHKVVPLAWKESHITTIYKGCASDDPSNYWLIAVVPVVAKILENIVITQLGIYLEQNNLLHPHQGAYHCWKFTIRISYCWEVIILLHYWIRGSIVCGAFIDLRKAFDSLDHCLLLQRISELGWCSTVRCEVAKFRTICLIAIYHRVITVGTFQHGDLWKVEYHRVVPWAHYCMLLISMNTLPSQLTDGLLLQYVDVTTVICSGVTTAAVQTTMCSLLSIIQQWIQQSKMKINFRKISVMWFRVTGFSYLLLLPIDGIELTVTKKQKYLGLIFDCSLSWAYHVASV